MMVSSIRQTIGTKLQDSFISYCTVCGLKEFIVLLLSDKKKVGQGLGATLQLNQPYTCFITFPLVPVT